MGYLVASFKFYGADIAQRRVSSLLIIKHFYVIEKTLFGFFSGLVIFVIDPFRFQTSEETFHHCVIPTVAFTAHALHKAVFTDPPGKCDAGILDAAIEVDNQSPRRLPLIDSPLQRDQRRAQRPTHHASKVQVDEDDQIQPAATDAKVGCRVGPERRLLASNSSLISTSSLRICSVRGLIGRRCYA